MGLIRLDRDNLRAVDAVAVQLSPAMSGAPSNSGILGVVPSGYVIPKIRPAAVRPDQRGSVQGIKIQKDVQFLKFP